MRVSVHLICVSVFAYAKSRVFFMTGLKKGFKLQQIPESPFLLDSDS